MPTIVRNMSTSTLNFGTVPKLTEKVLPLTLVVNRVPLSGNVTIGPPPPHVSIEFPAGSGFKLLPNTIVVPIVNPQQTLVVNVKWRPTSSAETLSDHPILMVQCDLDPAGTQFPVKLVGHSSNGLSIAQEDAVAEEE
jgi:hypothetical protein